MNCKFLRVDLHRVPAGLASEFQHKKKHHQLKTSGAGDVPAGLASEFNY
jgi:hypothetical protein